jgi:hypothetical protein
MLNFAILRALVLILSANMISIIYAKCIHTKRLVADMLNVLLLSVIRPYVLRLSVIMPCVNMLTVIMMSVTDAECLYVECLMLIVIKMSVNMLKVIVLSVIIPYVLVLAERHYVMCQYADCHYDKHH